jgi:hypothetical protein
MEFSLILPAAAVLADLAIVLFVLSGDPRAAFRRPLLTLYLCLTGWNLGVALMVGAASAERAWFYLFIMRHFLFLTPLIFLWFALCVSGRSASLRWRAVLWTACTYVVLFMILAAWTYLTGSRMLIAEIRRYDWGFFPYTTPLARVLLGTLFAGCLVPAFAALLSPRVPLTWLLRPGGDPPAGSAATRGSSRFLLPGLFALWWCGIATAILPLTGVDFYPLGNAADALVGFCIAVYLRGLRDDPGAQPGRRDFTAFAGMLVSASFGVFVTFFFLEFLLPVQAATTGLGGAVTAFAALLVFQRWFAQRSALTHGRPAVDVGRPLFVILQTRYGLTYQEAVICTALHDGQPRGAIVRRLAVSDGTFRNHLSEIYRKTVDKVEQPVGKSRDKLQRLTVFLKNISET